jgi:hypothetical protein
MLNYFQEALNHSQVLMTDVSFVSDRGHTQSGTPNHHQHIQQNPVQRLDGSALFLTQNLSQALTQL